MDMEIEFVDPESLVDLMDLHGLDPQTPAEVLAAVNKLVGHELEIGVDVHRKITDDLIQFLRLEEINS